MVLQVGGVLDRRKVCDLSELSQYDVVVNCLGLGALKLFNDNKMFPVRYATHLCCYKIACEELLLSGCAAVALADKCCCGNSNICAHDLSSSYFTNRLSGLGPI